MPTTKSLSTPLSGVFFVLNHIRCRLGFACGLRLISGFRIVYRKAVAGLGKCRISHHLPERRRENFRRQFQSSALNRQEPREHRQEPQNHPIQQEASQRNYPRRNRHKSVVRCVPRTDFAGRRGNPRPSLCAFWTASLPLSSSSEPLSFADSTQPGPFSFTASTASEVVSFTVCHQPGAFSLTPR